ncbi:MAG: hypothetical protein F4124_12825 [Acidimicrobiia bacterium]|nr:hypothetical protein [Acidimicrobiia bacterium]MYB72694.1 hypothetical protein [Acidimicrobiia bacterium]MYI00302.1 hypothetical protein [Acidimicrobiia bacterium]
MESEQGNEDAYRLAFEATLRTIDEQMRTLADLRTRVNVLVITSFGGAAVISSTIISSGARITPLGFAGMALAALCGILVFICATSVWKPRDWSVNMDAVKMVRSIEKGTRASHIYKQHALKMEEPINKNRNSLKILHKVFGRAYRIMLAGLVGLALLIGDVAVSETKPPEDQETEENTGEGDDWNVVETRGLPDDIQTKKARSED